MTNPIDGSIHVFKIQGETITMVGSLNTTFAEIEKEEFQSSTLDGQFSRIPNCAALSDNVGEIVTERIPCLFFCQAPPLPQ